MIRHKVCLLLLFLFLIKFKLLEQRNQILLLLLLLLRMLSMTSQRFITKKQKFSVIDVIVIIASDFFYNKSFWV